MKTLTEISREERFNEDIHELKKMAKRFQKPSRRNTLKDAIRESIEDAEWGEWND